MESFLPILNAIDSFLWGAPLIVLLVGTGILLTVRLSLIQVVRLPQELRLQRAGGSVTYRALRRSASHSPRPSARATLSASPRR